MQTNESRPSRRGVLIASLAALLSAPARRPWAAGEPGDRLPPPGHFDYRVLRDGDEIGTHAMDFGQSGDRLTVDTHIAVELTAIGITVFRFRHEAREVWVQGGLQSLSSRTDDDGTERAVELRAAGNTLHVTYNGKIREFPGPMLPASLWHPATVRQTVLFDGSRGKPRHVTVADRGEEIVPVGNDRIATHRYAIAGELTREVWYGPDGHIVQVTFPTKDGSTITVLRRA